MYCNDHVSNFNLRIKYNEFFGSLNLMTSSAPARTLNFAQAVGATFKTIPGSVGVWTAAGSCAYALYYTPAAPAAPIIQLVATVLSLSNETKFRLKKENIQYESITDHLQNCAQGIHSLFNNKNLFSFLWNKVPQPLRATLDQGWKSPALTARQVLK